MQGKGNLYARPETTKKSVTGLDHKIFIQVINIQDAQGQIISEQYFYPNKISTTFPTVSTHHPVFWLYPARWRYSNMKKKSPAQ